jgi:hypothetical protein
MLRLASDADVNDDILSGLFHRRPTLNLISVREVGLRTAGDPKILEWTAAEDRILITQDRSTMTHFANQRIAAALRMPGMFVIRNKPPFGPLIDDILLLDSCSIEDEWNNRVIFLPL